MNTVVIAPESRRREWWAEELAEVRAMTEREMENLITEDDTPVDNIFSEKQQRLLTEPLYSAWPGPEQAAPEHCRFLALANVGLFYALREPPLVPDVMLALDVPGVGSDLSQKANRSYFVWEQAGKRPIAAVEIVSNREGGEDSEKLRKYAVAGVLHYAIFDPWRRLSDRVFRVYQLVSGTYIEEAGRLLAGVGMGLTLWQGEYEGVNALWLRWIDRRGQLIPTGAECAEQEHQRAEQEHQHAEQERQRAEQERQRAEQGQQRALTAEQRAERLAAQLRELGIDPAE